MMRLVNAANQQHDSSDELFEAPEDNRGIANLLAYRAA